MKYKSNVCAAIHETMQGLHDIGLIDDAQMRQFDKSCLTPVPPIGRTSRQPQNRFASPDHTA